LIHLQPFVKEQIRKRTMDVEPGEFLVLLGPSGCGKTTALRMIAGLETVDDGTIELGGRDITRIKRLLRTSASHSR